jgi:hypothetical protein
VAEELQKLKDDVKKNFIKKGDLRERMILQDMTDPHGNCGQKKVIGAVGGQLGQLIMVISAAITTQKDKTGGFIDKQHIQTFFAQYCANQMKCDKFSILFGKEMEAFCKQNEFAINSLHKLKKAQKDMVINRLLNYEEGICNKTLAWLHQNCDILGIDQQVFEMVYESFIEVMLKRPIVKEGTLAKLEPSIQKIRQSVFPEDFNWEDHKFKALVRIRIPIEEIKEGDDRRPKTTGTEEQVEGESDAEKTGEAKPSVNESKITDGDGEKHPEFSKDTIKAQEIPAGDEKKWQEADIIDQVLMLKTRGEEFNIYALH